MKGVVGMTDNRFSTGVVNNNGTEQRGECDMTDNKNIYETMEKDVMNSDVPEETKEKLLKNIMKLKNQKLNILITGATGCGKSSTINALFNSEVAKVGVGVDPETMDIQKYEMNNMILWDSPGLGDGKEADNRHAKNIIRKLAETDENGNALIDLVLVILDGGSRDLGTSYELINNVIIPNLGPNRKGRILVAINQADMAMKGKHWDYINNRPDEVLQKFLEDKVRSVKARIKEGTGEEIEPIYYSAGYKEEGEEQQNPYNLSKLLYYIVQMTPLKKRIVYQDNLNTQEEMWKDDDKLIDYGKEVRKSFMESVIDGVSEGADIGEEIGNIFGSTAGKIGRVVGGVIGGVIEAGKAILGGLGFGGGWRSWF